MSVTSASVSRFNHDGLLSKGYGVLVCRPNALVVTLRGTGMLDVFDRRTWAQVAFLDFDLDRAIHLDTAFGPPLIGLPFTPSVHRELGVALEASETLRQQHHYGFFIAPPYRNRGARGVWNLDEFLVAIALNYAATSGLTSLCIAPTGDTAPYYRRKFNAQTGPEISAKKTLTVPLGPNRRPLPHVRNIRSAGRIVALEVPTGPDPSWPPALV